MTTEQREEAIRREAFVQGYVAAREPATPHETLLQCAAADKAYAEWRKSRLG